MQKDYLIQKKYLQIKDLVNYFKIKLMKLYNNNKHHKINIQLLNQMNKLYKVYHQKKYLLQIIDNIVKLQMLNIIRI